MREQSPRSKVATYHAWPDCARFAISGLLAWRIENDGPGDAAFDVGDDVGATLADGVIREAVALVDGTTVTRVPPSNLGVGCAVSQLEADVGALVHVNGVPAEAFAETVPCRVGSDRRRIAGEFRRFADVEGTALPRDSSAVRRSTRNGVHPGIGAKQKSAIRGPRSIAKKPAASSNGRPEERDGRDREIAMSRKEKK